MTFGSLFAGIGGLDLGLERAGLTCRWQVEIDPFCRKVLAKHWLEVPKYGDIRQVTGAELEPVDLICGGYPCQPFSQAGKRAGESDERHLWPEFARLIRLLRPRYVLLENVPGHLSLGFGSVLGDLAGLGYDAEWICLRASDFGASHLRKRIFVVAYDTQHLGRRQPLGAELADGTPGGRRELREPPGRDGLTDGSHAELGDSARDARDGPHGQDGGRRGVCEAGDRLSDAAGSRWKKTGERCNLDARCESEAGGGEVGHALCQGLEIGNAQREPHARQEPESIPASLQFAPGPSDPRWSAILSDRPDLAPALKSPLRRVADGVPAGLDGALKDRTKRLKALGNAVVSQCAEWIGRNIMEAQL